MKWGRYANSLVSHLARQVESRHHSDLSISGIWAVLGVWTSCREVFFFLRLSLQGYSWWHWRRRWTSEWAIQSFSPDTSLVREVKYSRNVSSLVFEYLFFNLSVKVGFRSIFLCVLLWLLLLFSWFDDEAAPAWGVVVTRRLSSVLTVLSAGSLLPLHGRESYSWAEPRGGGGQRWLWQWREPNPFYHQENHTAPPPHWPLWGEVKNELFSSPASTQVLNFVLVVVSVDWLPALWEKLLQRARGAQQLERNSSDRVTAEVELEGGKS